MNASSPQAPVHVFLCAFAEDDLFRAYAAERWEPEPPADASEAEYQAWEDRNPVWPFRDDLGGPYLDHDFIELIGSDAPAGAAPFAYLALLLAEPDALAEIEAQSDALPPGPRQLILLFDAALGGFPWSLTSTRRATYCGAFAVKSHLGA